MSEVFGTLQNALGSFLSLMYRVIPVYGVTIILLTLLVRAVLLPLTLKQTRSMQAMQRIQPHVKELQKKYKGDRQRLNQELMKLYKEHQVNPLGGCLPLLMQMPVFILLFTILRAAIPVTAVPSTPVTDARVTARETFCRPAGSVGDTGRTAVTCEFQDASTKTFQITEWEEKAGPTTPQAPPFLSVCHGARESDTAPIQFICQSPTGTGHLPRDSDLFGDIVADRTVFLGMHLGCGPTQAASPTSVRLCAPPGTEAGVLPAIPYFVLVALMVLSTWYQQKQMQRASATQQPAQQTMARIMPVFLGFISLQIPTGVLVYWVTTNAWQIGQQRVILGSRVQAPSTGDGRARTGDGRPRPQNPAAGLVEKGPISSGEIAKRRKRARGRKKRRKR